MIAKVIFICLTAVVATNAYSNGAPDEACFDMVPQHGVAPQSSAAPYQKNQLRSGDKVDVTINGLKRTDSIKGFMAQVRVGETPVGKWLVDKNNAYGQKLDCGNGSGEAQGSGRGDNYTAALYRILLKGYRTNQEGKRVKWEKSVICKRLPDSKARREAYRSEELFRNEVEFYNKIFPELLQFQQKQADDVLKAIPHCYLARNDLVILEDLRVRGFEMPNRQEGLTYEQTLAVLKELARFHSLSLSYKDQFPAEFNRLKSQVSEGIFTETNIEWYRNYYKILTKNAIDMVSQTLSPNSVYVEKLKKFVGNNLFFSNMVELVNRETTLATLCHGDCWTNNFLYKYNGNNDILETCLVDFQLIRYGSLALDISNLIFCCTDKSLRQNHMQTLLECYYQELVKSLRTLGPLPSFCNTEEQLWTQIQSEFQSYAKFGLGLAIDILPISTCTAEEAPDLYLIRGKEETIGAPALDVPPNEICRQKMTDIVIDLVDGGML